MRMSVKADNPIHIHFTGHERGLIDIDSNGPVSSSAA